MSDYWWPRSIKPLTNRNYSMRRGSNVIGSQVQGGNDRAALKYSTEPVPFNLNFILSDGAYNALLNFYDVAINHGASSFKMMLDSGTGIVEHQCIIVPNSWNAVRPSHGTWSLALRVNAEVTPSQNEVCDNLYQLWDCYGDQSCALINAFEDFVNGTPKL